MAYTLTVSNDYGYVILAACSTFVLSIVHSVHTGKFRKAAAIPYPNAYATAEAASASKEAYLFNCAQRAHANYMEHFPMTLGSLLIAGLRYPLVSAALGASWTVSRYLYMIGYTKPSWGPKGRGRYKGVTFYVGELGLLGLAAWTGIQMVLGN